MDIENEDPEDETPPITTLGYLGRLFLAYMGAMVLFIPIYLVPLIWAGAFLDEVVSNPVLKALAGIFAVVLVPFTAVVLAVYTALFFIPHGLLMLIYMGIRQRGPTVRTPIVDMLASGGLLYFFAFLFFEAYRGASFWVWYGLISAATVGGVIGIASFRLSRARQAALAMPRRKRRRRDPEEPGDEDLAPLVPAD